MELLDLKSQVKETLSNMSHLFAAMQSPSGNLSEDLKLVLFEEPEPKLNDFKISVYKWKKPFEEISRVDSRLGKTSLTELSILSGYSNSGQQNGCINTFDGVQCYIRPLSLWLGPVGFLVVPFTDGQLIEKEISKNSNALQSSLSRVLMARAHSKLSIKDLIKLSEEDFIQELAMNAAQILMPRSWRIGNNRHAPYAERLFANLHSQTLNLTLPNGEDLICEMPPVTQYISSWPCLWAYSENRLQKQKEEIKKGIETYFDKWFKDYQDLHEELGSRNTIPGFGLRLEEVELVLDELKEKVNDLSHQLAAASHPGVFQNQGAYELYSKNGDNFIVKFSGTQISCLKRQSCRILHILLSNPNVTYDMYTLYLLTKQYGDTANVTNTEVFQSIIKVLSEHLVSEGEIKMAKTYEERGELRNRIKTVISFLKKAIDKVTKQEYSEKEIEALRYHLQHQQGLSEEYFDPDWDTPFSEVDEVSSSASINTIEPKKKWRERISKHLNEAKARLAQNNAEHFKKYLEETVRREQEYGVHYYTFRPDAASIQKHRKAEWKL